MTRTAPSSPLGGLTTDATRRAAALDPGRSFIVQAPAGSGKTELLIQRFLSLLACVGQPEAIVALTFTRKAAAEMRSRVVGALEAASGPEPEADHERDTWQLARAALGRNDDLHWNLIEHPSRLRIQTIDSLCATLVRQMPWVSRMGAPTEPDENVADLYRRAARRTLDHLDSDSPNAESVGRVLSHLDNDAVVAGRLLTSMLSRRDQWLRHVVSTGPSEGLRRRFAGVLWQIIGDELGALTRVFPDDDLVTIVECARFAANNLIERGVQSPITHCRDLEGLPDPDVNGLHAWLGLRELFLTREGRRRKSLNIRQGFPPTGEGKSYKAMLAQVQFDPVVADRLHRIASLPPPSHTETQWKTLESLLGLLPIAVAELKGVFREEGRVDFAEISQAARRALGTSGVPTGLAFSLDCRIQHLLVDEFQDTSQSQFDLLEALTADWQPDDGHTLFVVGDPMQSIYGFREADVALFLRARRDGLADVGLTSLTLSTNFRSSPGVVDWINDAMAQAFPGDEDMLTGAVSYEHSTASNAQDVGLEPAVTVHPFFDPEPEREASRVVDIVQDRQRAEPPATIAVLVRARAHLVHVARALRRRDVPFEAVEIDALKSRSVVQDLLALTRALTNAADRVAWLTVLRAPWCGLTLGDLDQLIGGDFDRTVWDLIRDRADPSAANGFVGLSLEGSRRLQRIVPILADALDRRGRTSLRNQVEATWLALGGPACLDHGADLDDALTYLDLVSEAAPGTAIRDIDRFNDGVERLFAESGAGGRQGVVQLLTIHKAKGLEFDTVILPGLGQRTRAEGAHLLEWLEYTDREGVPRLLLAPIRETGTQDDRMTAYLKGLASCRREHETTRLMYVAMTRARRHLHLLGHVGVDSESGEVRGPDSRSLLARIWPKVESDFRRARSQQTESMFAGDGRKADRAPLRRLSLGWEMPVPEPDGAWRGSSTSAFEEAPTHHPTFDWATDIQRRVGVVVHGILQRIRPVGAGGPVPRVGDGTIRAALASEGLGGRKLDIAIERVRTAIWNATSDERGLWILSRHEDDHWEHPLTWVSGGVVRRYVLDRTFVDDGVRWIIDYKTGIHEGAGLEAFLDNEQARYRTQLEDYARAMTSVGETRPMRLGLYFPLLRAWREWPFGEPSGSAAPVGSDAVPPEAPHS